MLNTEWNGILFGSVLGCLLAVAGMFVSTNPWAIIFLLITINILHYVIPPTKGPF